MSTFTIETKDNKGYTSSEVFVWDKTDGSWLKCTEEAQIMLSDVVKVITKAYSTTICLRGSEIKKIVREKEHKI